MVKNFLLTLILSTCFLISQGQDKQILKDYIRESFGISFNYPIPFPGKDFFLKEYTQTPEKPSFERAQELIDSLKFHQDSIYDFYLFQIGLIYNQLNRKTLAKKYFTEALDSLLQKDKKNPDDFYTLQGLATVCAWSGDFIATAKYFDKCVEINPSDSSLLNLGVTIVLSTYATNSQRLQAYIDTLINHDPHYYGGYYLKTLDLITSETKNLVSTNKTDSIENSFSGFNSDFSYLDSAINVYPDDEEFRFMLTTMKFMVDFSEVMLKQRSRSLNNISDLFSYDAKSSEALKSYNAYLQNLSKKKRWKTNPYLFYMLGQTSILDGKYRPANRYFTRANKVNKRLETKSVAARSQIYNGFIMASVEKKDSVAAAKWLQRKTNHQPRFENDPNDYINLAHLRFHDGKTDKARILLEQALDIDSMAFDAYLDLAYLEMYIDNYHTATKWLDRCYKLSKRIPKWYEARMTLALLTDDRTTAKYILKLILENDPGNSLALEVKEEFFNNE